MQRIFASIPNRVIQAKHAANDTKILNNYEVIIK
jgi:hypothetical protein